MLVLLQCLRLTPKTLLLGIIKCVGYSLCSLESCSSHIRSSGLIWRPFFVSSLQKYSLQVPSQAALLSSRILQEQTSSVTRKVQGQIRAKLKWKSSYEAMRTKDTKKGGRVEVVCQHPEVFGRIFEGTDIKTAKHGKLSCTFKTDDGVFSLPFKGKSYHYHLSKLRAPCSASFKDGVLTFSSKYSIGYTLSFCLIRAVPLYAWTCIQIPHISINRQMMHQELTYV